LSGSKDVGIARELGDIPERIIFRYSAFLEFLIAERACGFNIHDGPINNSINVTLDAEDLNLLLSTFDRMASLFCEEKDELLNQVSIQKFQIGFR